MRGPIALLLLAAAGCAAEPTQLVVVVDSDLAVPDDVVAISVETVDPTGVTLSDVRFALAAPGEGSPPARFELPLSFGVVPIDDDASRRVTVVARAPGPSDEVLVEQRFRAGFVAGQRLLLPMFLLDRCVDRSCGADETCAPPGCVSQDVPPDDLRPARPGAELDGGTDPGCGAEDSDGDGVGDRCDDWPCGPRPSIAEVNETPFVRISDVRLDGEARNTLVVAPGADVPIRFTYFVTDPLCDSCIDQVEIGFIPGTRQYCAYDDVPPPDGFTGESDAVLTAPTEPGLYDLRSQLGQNFACDHMGADNWWIAEPPPEQTFGAICVRE
ncbi:MAG: hypothetical protein VYE22_25290 [Myxococcota bacterium]|nr:hypothetical protein [Myxococcota bacterium]